MYHDKTLLELGMSSFFLIQIHMHGQDHKTLTGLFLGFCGKAPWSNWEFLGDKLLKLVNTFPK